MGSSDYVNGYEEWHKRIADMYRSLEGNLALKSKVAQHNPAIWCKTEGEESLEYRVAKACASLDDRIGNINRKKKGGHYARKIYLQDIYALCAAIGKTPNDYLLPPLTDTESFPALMRDSRDTLYSLLKYISRIGTLKSFIKFYYYEHIVEEGTPEDDKEFQRALSNFDTLSLPDDLIFMIAFKAEILKSISDVFQTDNPNLDQYSLENKFSQVRKSSKSNGVHIFNLEVSPVQRDMYCVLIRTAFTEQEVEKENIFTYGFLDDDDFLDYWWDTESFDYSDCDDDLESLKRWDPQKRFELSLYLYLLVCVFEAIIRLQQYHHANWEDDFVNDCKKYISDNTAVRQLIRTLFLRSFLRLNNSAIISAYGQRKTEPQKSNRTTTKKSDKQVTEHKQQKQHGKNIDELAAHAAQRAKVSK